MANSVEKYLAQYPAEVRQKLESVRAAIKSAAPKAEERLGYGMPGYYQNGPLVYFAAWKNHIGFYPTASGIRAFQDELSQYEGAKGSVKFPFAKKLPLGLIKKIVRHRVQENQKKATA